MKKKAIQSLRGMSEHELTKHIRTLEGEVIKFRLEKWTKQVKNVREPRAKRLAIAVAKTILGEREPV